MLVALTAALRFYEFARKYNYGKNAMEMMCYVIRNMSCERANLGVYILYQVTLQ
jgi:hypothetical protein